MQVNVSPAPIEIPVNKPDAEHDEHDTANDRPEHLEGKRDAKAKKNKKQSDANHDQGREHGPCDLSAGFAFFHISRRECFEECGTDKTGSKTDKYPGTGVSGKKPDAKAD